MYWSTHQNGIKVTNKFRTQPAALLRHEKFNKGLKELTVLADESICIISGYPHGSGLQSSRLTCGIYLQTSAHSWFSFRNQTGRAWKEHWFPVCLDLLSLGNKIIENHLKSIKYITKIPISFYHIISTLYFHYYKSSNLVYSQIVGLVSGVIMTANLGRSLILFFQITWNRYLSVILENRTVLFGHF